MRKNGKNWHATRAAFRPASATTRSSDPHASDKAFLARRKLTTSINATKSLERTLKAEKEEKRQQQVQAIKDKRAKKEERERYQQLAEKMHRKRVERLKRREKRNKLLKS